MDTTLRDGEQTSGVSFSAEEKLSIAKILLTEVKVDRLEVASARVSEGEMEAVKAITRWANRHNFLNKIEVLTFVDTPASLDWMQKAGAKVQNLLTKGSLNHLTHQLGKKPEEHFSEIQTNLSEAEKRSILSNVYLEDWSNGMRNSKNYVFEFLDFLNSQNISRVMLPDTLGVLTPHETFLFLEEIINRYPHMHFDFHAHNDYDLGVANVLEAVRAGVKGIHLTVNGMGERAGNAPIASCIACLKDFLPEVKFAANEEYMYKISKLVEAFSGIRVPSNKPIVGDHVFTQTAGIHADGDNKKNLYFNDLMPERFGRERQYALGKTSGKANIQKNLKNLGIKLNDEEVKILTQKIIELGDKKEVVTPADLPFIISDVLDQRKIQQNIRIETFNLTHAQGLKPFAALKINYKGQSYETTATGDGQYDAFMNALKQLYKTLNKPLPALLDYSVRIPPGGHTDALCETFITWKHHNNHLKTRGLDSDQTISAIKATERMLNIIESDYNQ